MDALFDNPAMLFAAGGVLIGLLVVLRLVRNVQWKRERGVLPGVEKQLAAGNYLQAAAIAIKYGHFEEAMDYYLRAQEPARAAQVAVRIGNARRAGELYEKAGDLERAAHQYQQAGMVEKSRELRERAGKERADRSLAPGARDSLGAPRRESLGAPRRDGLGARPASEPPDLGAAEAAFRRVQAEAGADLAGKTRLQEAGVEAAEALLRDGNIRRAAEVYRDAGLYDEAIHLYVNVLGAPGEAAPLVAARGNHERAAELYELAGQAQRAAAMWVEIALNSTTPETYLDRIEQLSEEIAFRFLEDNVGARPPEKRTAEMHYRFARALERRGERDRAIEVYVTLNARVPEYRDAGSRLNTLRSAGPLAAEQPGPARASQRPAAAPTTDRELPADQISQIARQAAEAAIEQAKRAGRLVPLTDAPPSSRREPRTQIVVVGLEQAQLSMEALADSAVAAARDGPSLGALERFTGGRPCDLGNIEVYYRIGLWHLAAGQWQDALRAFEAVEEASPGYRDADRRAEEIRRWQQALGSRRSLVAPPRAGVGAAAAQPARYQIRGELGRGGMAVVYRARDEVLGRDVALKFIAEEFLANENVHEMFQREARSAAQLNHPNIVTVYDVGVLEGKAFICMELLDGVAVEDLVEQRGRLPIVEALRVVRQVLEALDYAHARDIIHRDIKPSNMMRTSTGLVKLMDFGLAKSIKHAVKASIIAGTPAYMPPEQYSGENVDQRSDLFAVGVVLYELLSGKLPFPPADRSRPAESMRVHDPALPELLDDIVLKAIQLDPGQRYQTAREFASAVRAVLDAVDRHTAGDSLPPAPAPPPDPQDSPATRKTEMARKQPL